MCLAASRVFEVAGLPVTCLDVGNAESSSCCPAEDAFAILQSARPVSRGSASFMRRLASDVVSIVARSERSPS